jgi:hypothetical protein
VIRSRYIAIAVLFAAASIPTTLQTGFAASLGTISGGLAGGGEDAVVPCDNGFGTSYTTSGGNATSVTITGIADPACEGGSLKVALVNGSNTAVASGGPAAVPSDGDTSDNSVTLPLSPQPVTTSVARIHVSITGP